MKSFTALPLVDNQQAKPEDLNDNLELTLEQFNGHLDGSNMPVASISDEHLSILVEPVPEPIGLGATGTTQMYVQSAVAGADVWTPITSISLQDDNWRRGWNILHTFPLLSGAQLSAVTKEGMIVGCATIDWHRGQQFKTAIVEETPINVRAGADWWTEWGVFVNNLLVARSGRIYPRRHTTSMPFTIPVGSQPVEVDIRFITNNDHDARFSVDINTDLDIFSYNIWIRNVYR